MLNSVLPEDRGKVARMLALACGEQTLESILTTKGMLLAFQNELLSKTGSQQKNLIAQICLSLLGDELLKEGKIRRDVASYLDVPFVEKWVPGSKEAQEFCLVAELPRAFAGSLKVAKPPPFYIVRPSSDLGDLRDYQQELVKAALENASRHRRQLLSIPTGGGKTRVATEIAYAWLADEGNTTGLWLAHTEELCEQAFQCFDQLWRSKNSQSELYLYRAWGRNSKTLEKGEYFRADIFSEQKLRDKHVIISTPQTAVRYFSSRLQGDFGRALEGLSLVIIDEAHRAAADSYRKLLRLIDKRYGERTLTLGLSATPVRETYGADPLQGTEELRKLFDVLVEPVKTFGKDHDAIQVLRERKILSYLIIERIKPGPIKMQSQRIAREMKSEDAVSPGLLFADSVASASLYSFYLNQNGIRSEVLSAKTSAEDRSRIVDGFKNKRVDLICNCEILTTGFDVPGVSKIFLARDTKSPILYKQIVGRGLRGPEFGGSETCQLYLCGIERPFAIDPNTAEFARLVWR